MDILTFEDQLEVGDRYEVFTSHLKKGVEGPLYWIVEEPRQEFGSVGGYYEYKAQAGRLVRSPRGGTAGTGTCLMLDRVNTGEWVKVQELYPAIGLA